MVDIVLRVFRMEDPTYLPGKMLVGACVDRELERAYRSFGKTTESRRL